MSYDKANVTHLIKLHLDSTTEKPKCGCKWAWFDNRTNVGMVVAGDKLCEMGNDHPTIYQPSKNMIKSGQAFEMYETLKQAKKIP